VVFVASKVDSDISARGGAIQSVGVLAYEFEGDVFWSRRCAAVDLASEEFQNFASSLLPGCSIFNFRAVKVEKRIGQGIGRDL
jgi:hypothetical protein